VERHSRVIDRLEISPDTVGGVMRCECAIGRIRAPVPVSGFQFEQRREMATDSQQLSRRTFFHNSAGLQLHDAIRVACCCQSVRN
jgi:hypothetical protein